MSQLTGKCSPGIKNGTRQGVRTYTSQRISPTPGLAQSFAHAYTLGQHSSTLTKSSGPPPFKPLPYRVFSAEFRGNAYSMDLVSPDKSIWNVRGSTAFGATDFDGAGSLIYHGCKFSGGGYVPDVSLNMENQAITEALNDLQDNKTNILVSVAEARESFDFIANIVRRILFAYRQARRGNWRGAFDLISGRSTRGPYRGAKGWLAFHYAVLPMLGDIQGAFQLAKQGLKDSPFLVGRRFLSSGYGLPGKPSHFKSFRCTGRCDVGVEVCLSARLNDPTITLLGQMGLYNPFSVAWELVPFSFVIDWLIPIGNALEALTATLGLTFHSGYINHKTVSDFNWSGHGHSFSLVSGVEPSANVKNVCQWRKTYVSFPRARLYVKSPFSTTHVVSAVALLHALRR